MCLDYTSTEAKTKFLLVSYLVLIIDSFNPFSNTRWFNPRAKKKGGEWMPPPPNKVFLQFFQDDFSSAPVVFSSCRHIHYTNTDASLVGIGCYGYEI